MDYYPENVPTDTLRALAEALNRQLLTISAAINSKLESQIEYLAAEPMTVKDGMIVGADGTNWNPGGTGKGIYVRVTSSWVKL